MVVEIEETRLLTTIVDSLSVHQHMFVTTLKGSPQSWLISLQSRFLEALVWGSHLSCQGSEPMQGNTERSTIWDNVIREYEARKKRKQLVREKHRKEATMEGLDDL